MVQISNRPVSGKLHNTNIALASQLNTIGIYYQTFEESDDLKNKIFSNMSERAADLINEEMQFMGPVRVSDVEAAQQRIVDIVRRFEDAGEIIISGRGGEKEMIA